MNKIPENDPHHVGWSMLRPGPLTWLACLAIVVLQFALGTGKAPDESTWRTQAWLASVWAFWAISLWILVRQPLSLKRVVLLGISFGWHCAMLGLVMGRPPERCLILLGSYGVLQTTAATLLGLPQWQNLSSDSKNPADFRPAPPRQFGILSIVVLTAVVALILVSARRYADVAGVGFISGSISALSLLCIVGIAAMATSASSKGRLFGLPLILILSAVVAAILGMMEDLTATSLSYSEFWWIYCSIVLQSASLIYLVGVCGYLDTVPDVERVSKGDSPRR